jgi:hypothetical protein
MRVSCGLQIQLVPDVSFLDGLASQCLAKLSGFSAEQLATTMWSFASLGYIPGGEGSPGLDQMLTALLA